MIIRVLAYVWASPATCVGLAGAFLGWLTGGKVNVIQGVVEAWGGAIGWCLSRAPLAGGAAAITVGHVILGQDALLLDRFRTHEHVHVRQYERWGPLFIPAYLIASAVAWTQGKDPYRDNPFEREAYALDQQP